MVNKNKTQSSDKQETANTITSKKRTGQLGDGVGSVGERFCPAHL